MAIQADQPGAKEKEEDKKGQPLGGAPTPSSGSAPAGGIGGAGAPAQQQKGPSSSGVFTDVGKYVQANQPSIGKFAQQTAQGFQDKVSGIGKGAEEEAQGIISGVEGQKLDSSGYKGKKATEITPGFGQGVNLPSGADASLASSREQAARAQARAETLGDMGGRSAYLKETLTPSINDYSAGENRLDTIFSMRDPTARQTFRDTQQQAQDLSSTIGSLESDIGTAITDVQGHNQTVMDDYTNYLKGLEKGIQDSHAGELGGRRSDLMSFGERELRDIFSGNAYSQDKLIDKIVADAGTGVSQFSSSPTRSTTQQNVAYEGPDVATAWDRYKREASPDLQGGYTAEQVAELQALDELLGRDKQGYDVYNQDKQRQAFKDWLRETYGSIGSEVDPYAGTGPTQTPETVQSQALGSSTYRGPGVTLPGNQ